MEFLNSFMVFNVLKCIYSLSSRMQKICSLMLVFLLLWIMLGFFSQESFFVNSFWKYDSISMVKRNLDKIYRKFWVFISKTSWQSLKWIDRMALEKSWPQFPKMRFWVTWAWSTRGAMKHASENVVGMKFWIFKVGVTL